MEYKIFNAKRGFTIIEVAIALFVLTVAIFGVYGAFSVMVITTAQMTDRFTASYLTQEGIEIVRNMRDANWLKDPAVDWKTGIADASVNCTIAGCKADYRSGNALAAYGDSYLNIDANGFYNYNTGTKTKFKRRIVIDTLFNSSGIYAIKVIVTVYWDEKNTLLNPTGKPGSVTAEDYLYNWY